MIELTGFAVIALLICAVAIFLSAVDPNGDGNRRGADLVVRHVSTKSGSADEDEEEAKERRRRASSVLPAVLTCPPR